MSSIVEDIVSKLHSKFIEPLPVENAVMTSDGMEVCITVELWKESLVLRNHSVLCVPRKELDVPKSVLMSLIEAHGHGTFPKGIQESYDLLAASVKLELPNLIWKCFDNLCRVNALGDSVDIPPELSLDTVMRVFKVLSGTPLRTADIYEEQLSRISRYCANDRDKMTNAMNILRQSLEKFKSINLESLPVRFTARTVPIAILKRTEILKTAVIIGGELELVDLFGTHVNMRTLTGVSDFYLKYGDYLLYRDSDSLYHKNLRDDSRPTKLMDKCCKLLTRGKFVFATRAWSFCSSVSLWVDGRFEEIFRNRDAIKKIEFDDVTNVLAILQGSQLRLFRFKNGNLSLLEEKNDLTVPGVLLSGDEMFVIREDKLRVDFLLFRRDHSRNVAESGRPIYERTTVTYGRLFPNANYPEKWRSIVSCGGSYFLTADGRLELVTNHPRMDKTRTLMIDGELCALSELWMFP